MIAASPSHGVHGPAAAVPGRRTRRYIVYGGILDTGERASHEPCLLHVSSPHLRGLSSRDRGGTRQRGVSTRVGRCARGTFLGAAARNAQPAGVSAVAAGRAWDMRAGKSTSSGWCAPGDGQCLV